MPRPPLVLPSHLSYKSALVLLPPSTIWPPIQSLREKHNRCFKCWLPHINLIYPFVASPSINICAILSRIKSAVGNTPDHGPFNLQLNQSAHFQRPKDSATVYLTVSGDETEKVKSLQRALQQEFAECAADTRVFVPHLSIGQAKTSRAIEVLKREIESTVKPFAQTEECWSLDFLVDRIVEREGSNDPFRVVDEVLLPDQSHNG
jgi:2'-5' RNA ligase